MKHLLWFICSLCFLAPASATHNRAGEIHIQQIGDLTIRATIITYTKASSTQADRDSLEICWGDGACEFVQRSNGNGEGVLLGNDLKYNTYIIDHTFGGLGTFVISMTDQNRNGGVVNVNLGNSDAVPIHIQTSYTLLTSQFQGYNTTPYLLQPPIDEACIGQRFVHNPNAFDPDGDSLAYFLIVPLADISTNVPNFVFPNNIGSNIFDSFLINEVTGDLAWETPEIEGEYNIALIIISYRDGFAIDTTVRDMQIFVEECDNVPPEVEAPDEICVIAGDTIRFDVIVTDADSGQLVRLSALGGPFETAVSPAQLMVTAEYQPSPLIGEFTWNTTCEHISDQFYSVVFKGVDNYFGTSGLADLKLTRIKVVGPPPLNLQTAPLSGAILVSWDAPYACENAADDYFFRFAVWRRQGSNPFEIDTCTPGLEGKGYTRVAYLDEYAEADQYSYLDTAVERGRTYCYRIVADFAKYSNAGFPYNIVPSLPSEEVCLQLSRDVPLMLNVDVALTDATDGQIFVRWTKPLAEDLDTIQNPPPYRYRLLHRAGTTGNFEAVPGGDFVSTTYAAANDTFFTQSGLNTLSVQHFYKVELYVTNEVLPLGDSETASSVLLTVASTDQINNLSWTATTPWTNTSFDVFRRNNSTGLFELLGLTTTTQFSDTGLENGTSYCYYILATGAYGIVGLPEPLLNRSQEVCGIPLDTLPPCTPLLSITNPCLSGNYDVSVDSFINVLTWNNPALTCIGSADVAGYTVFNSLDSTLALPILATLNGAAETTFSHLGDLGLVGCYAIAAFDSLGNQSALSPIICVDNCPDYSLPNSFTPNSDGFNDFFISYPYRFIAYVKFEVRSQWGNLIYKTENPALGWDGTNLEGVPVAEGTYFYTCVVYEQRVGGPVQRPIVLGGFIELLR